MAVDSPRGEDAFSKAIFTWTPNVIHDFVATFFDDRFANARCDCVECFVPGCALPLSFAAFACAFEWIKNSIGVGNLVDQDYLRTFVLGQ